MFQILSASTFFPDIFPMYVFTYRGIGRPKSLQRASLYQTGQFQYYVTAQGCLWVPILMYTLHTSGEQHLYLCPRCMQGRISMRPRAAEPGWWQLAVPGSDLSMVRGERNSQSCSFPSAGCCPWAEVCQRYHCRAENMTMEIDAVFGEQNVPMCLACDPLCHNLTLWLSLVNQGCKKYICVLPPPSKDVASPAQREGIYEMPTLSNAIHLEQYKTWTSSTL